MGRLLLARTLSNDFPLKAWRVQFETQPKIPGSASHTLACGGVTPVHHSVPVRLPLERDGFDAVCVSVRVQASPLLMLV